MSRGPRGSRRGARAAVGGLAGSLLGVVLAVARSCPAEPVRVALAEAAGMVEVGVAEGATVRDAIARRVLFTVPGPRLLRVEPAGGALALVWGPGAPQRRRLPADTLRLDGDRGPLRVGGREYTGAVEVWAQGDTLLVVNELGLEDYVAGTVRAEVPERWPREALRALAVAARTYAVYHQQRNPSRAYHLVAGSQHQHFAGRVEPGTPAWEAARTTAGQVLTWQGTVFPAFYHSDSGGFTEPAHLVFPPEGVPPLPGVRDEYSLGSPYERWVVTLPLAALEARLRRGGVEVGPVTGLTVLERTASLRVAWIAVEHAGGRAVLRGTDFRRLVGHDVLRSTLFVPIAGPDGVVRFEGRGWGHGVGMSQFGARGMAEQGYEYVRILAHYYPGAALRTLASWPR